MYLHRTLHLDLEDHVIALGKFFIDRRFERAVVVIDIAGVL